MISYARNRPAGHALVYRRITDRLRAAKKEEVKLLEQSKGYAKGSLLIFSCLRFFCRRRKRMERIAERGFPNLQRTIALLAHLVLPQGSGALRNAPS
jgi:hypothetical protein